MGKRIFTVLLVLAAFSQASFADNHAPGEGNGYARPLSLKDFEGKIPEGILRMFPTERRSALSSAFEMMVVDATWAGLQAVNPEQAKKAMQPQDALRDFVVQLIDADPTLSETDIYKNLYAYFKAAAEKATSSGTPGGQIVGKRTEGASMIAKMRARTTENIRELLAKQDNMSPLARKIGEQELNRRKVQEWIKDTEVIAMRGDEEKLADALLKLPQGERQKIMTYLKNNPKTLASLVAFVSEPGFKDRLKDLSTDPAKANSDVRNLAALRNRVPAGDFRDLLDGAVGPYQAAVSDVGVYNSPTVLSTVQDLVDKGNRIHNGYRYAMNIKFGDQDAALFKDRFGRYLMVEGHKFDWYERLTNSGDQNKVNEAMRTLRRVKLSSDNRTVLATEKFDSFDPRTQKITFRSDVGRSDLAPGARRATQSAYYPNNGYLQEERPAHYIWIGDKPTNDSPYWVFTGRDGDTASMKDAMRQFKNWSVVLDRTHPQQVLRYYGTAKNEDGKKVHIYSDGRGNRIVQEEGGTWNSGKRYYDDESFKLAIDTSTISPIITTSH